ncbi:beta-glucoside-specific PTS transporter subunit IIABC [Enterococcus sp. CWB-B31]|uniref:beta-glucoside-specific PTS transporter subunit IIABC n=1 Tax=Enterococcus sp. CWB-B31 TaxID=2885159 RepID=UPI001E34BFCF|nr:beta-glucoside-specific PTS transporter subunit IIABC [Enterococcus sp. CWB-B31]MCB5954931.1 beta-glucoside-specific PTS transporter subunit IIABC [Enterococcus sp. CWB-B31]
MNNKELAQKILEGVGGKENINDVFHCATRLRFRLKNEDMASTSELKKMSEIIQIVRSGGQYQIVIGNEVSTVYESLLDVMGGNVAGDETTGEKQGLVAKFIDIVSSIFTPFLTVLAGTGVLKGLLSLAVFLSPEFAETGTYTLLNAAGDAFFRFLPIAIAFTAAKKFKTNQYIAMALAMAMVYPIENTADLTFISLPVIYGAGYTSTVFPIILAVLVQRYVEGLFKKIVPKFLIFGVTLLTLIIMVPLTYLLIGPLGTVIGSILSKGVNGLYEFSPLITGGILGGFWQILVVFGMHWGFVPLTLLNFSTLGYDSLLPMSIAGVIAQSGAAFGVFLKSKDKNMRSLAASSSLTALFGITEPAVYGVTLPLKKPFIAASIGGAIGGGVIAFFGVKSFAFNASILAIPNMIGRDGIESSAMMGIIGLSAAFVIAAILAFILGFDEGQEDKRIKKEIAANEEKPSVVSEKITVFSPMSGKLLSLEKVDDPVFSSGSMGRGVAILPSEGRVIAPVSGTVTLLFPTNHAIGIVSEEGAEILIHIGMDTVELNGEGFTPLVKQGDKVVLGQELLLFDEQFIKAHKKSTVTPIVITNSTDYHNIEIVVNGEVLAGQKLLEN